MAESEDAYTLGSAAVLTQEELVYLDAFELPAYRRTLIDVIIIRDDEEINVQAVAYIAVHPFWAALPSEQYLTAIYYMLREQWSDIHPDLDIAIKGIFKSDDFHNCKPLIRKISVWKYPGSHNLSLPALCVEVNTRLPPSKSWVMPVTINEILHRFSSVGIHSAAQLAVRLSENIHIFQEGESAFLPSGAELDYHALHAFKDLLLENHRHDRK